MKQRSMDGRCPSLMDWLQPSSHGQPLISFYSLLLQLKLNNWCNYTCDEQECSDLPTHVTLAHFIFKQCHYWMSSQIQLCFSFSNFIIQKLDLPIQDFDNQRSLQPWPWGIWTTTSPFIFSLSRHQCVEYLLSI